MPEINHNGGGWDMRTEGVEQSVTQLNSGLAAFESAWQAAASAINGAMANLGGGVMGEDFLKKYQPAADSMGQFVSQIIPALTGCGMAATGSVADYLAGDFEGKRGFDGIG